MGSGLPPFQTSMSSTLGQIGMGSAMDTQKSSGLFGMENKSGGSPFKNNDVMSSGGPGIHSMDHSTGIKKKGACMRYSRKQQGRVESVKRGYGSFLCQKFF